MKLRGMINNLGVLTYNELLTLRTAIDNDLAWRDSLACPEITNDPPIYGEIIDGMHIDEEDIDHLLPEKYL